MSKSCSTSSGNIPKFTLQSLLFVIMIVGIMASVVIPVAIAEHQHSVNHGSVKIAHSISGDAIR